MSRTHKNEAGGGRAPEGLCRRLVFLVIAAAVLLAAAAALLFSCGCGGAPQETPQVSIDVGFSPAPISLEGKRTPLAISMHSEEYKGCELRYPYVTDDGAALLNVAIRSGIVSFAETCRSNALFGDIDCEIKYNNRGLLSFLITVRDERGELLTVSTAAYDCGECRRLTLADCFGSGSDTYVFTLADIVTEKLAAEGLELISYVPPMEDDRLFYFDDAALTLVYRRYEICGADADAPQITIPYAEIEHLMNPDSVLRRLPRFE